MPNWRRAHCPGGTFFFTVVTQNRAKILCTDAARAILHQCLKICNERWPFETIAIVLLPEHMHMIWRLPENDPDYSKRIGWIKKEFTKSWLRLGGQEQNITTSQQHDRRRGVWQKKYWEHLLRDELDLQHHIDYIHYNPVKHGLVSTPVSWAWSSFHKAVKQGLYTSDWGGGDIRQHDLSYSVGE